MSEELGATAEVAEEVAEEVVEKSMDDTIRETLQSLKEKGAVIEETPETPESPEQKADRIRDEKGKFSKVGENAPVVGETLEPAAKPAPNTWKKEVAEKWATLPPEVQAEVERREADFHKGIEGYKAAAQFAQAMERAITPFAATLNSLKLSPDRAVGELLAADHRLRYSSPQEKLQHFAQLAKAYNVDLAQVPAQEQQYVDPTVSALQQQVQQLMGHVQNQQLTAKQQEEAALNSEIAAFKADPSHRHFESVKGHMAALLQAGQAQTLKDAYEQAIYANPTTRAAVLAEQQEAARKDAAEKAQAAKKAASVNVRARPSMPVSTPIGTMDDTIRQTLRRLRTA